MPILTPQLFPGSAFDRRSSDPEINEAQIFSPELEPQLGRIPLCPVLATIDPAHEPYVPILSLDDMLYVQWKAAGWRVENGTASFTYVPPPAFYANGTLKPTNEWDEGFTVSGTFSGEMSFNPSLSADASPVYDMSVLALGPRSKVFNFEVTNLPGTYTHGPAQGQSITDGRASIRMNLHAQSVRIWTVKGLVASDVSYRVNDNYTGIEGHEYFMYSREPLAASQFFCSPQVSASVEQAIMSNLPDPANTNYLSTGGFTFMGAGASLAGDAQGNWLPQGAVFIGSMSFDIVPSGLENF